MTCAIVHAGTSAWILVLTSRCLSIPLFQMVKCTTVNRLFCLQEVFNKMPIFVYSWSHRGCQCPTSSFHCWLKPLALTNLNGSSGDQSSWWTWHTSGLESHVMADFNRTVSVPILRQVRPGRPVLLTSSEKSHLVLAPYLCQSLGCHGNLYSSQLKDSCCVSTTSCSLVQKLCGTGHLKITARPW